MRNLVTEENRNRMREAEDWLTLKKFEKAYPYLSLFAEMYL